MHRLRRKKKQETTEVDARVTGTEDKMGLKQVVKRRIATAAMERVLRAMTGGGTASSYARDAQYLCS